ncbi:MAG: hypothetical protein V4515_07920 [Chloroflexota bacterium]
MVTRTLFTRFVVEMEVDATGRLRPRPNTLWWSEPAIGEAGIHRRLAKLNRASDDRIAAFASTYGPLRFAAAPLLGIPGPRLREVTFALGQGMLGDLDRVRVWLATGSHGRPPHEVRVVLALVELLQNLSEPTRRAVTLMVGGAPEAEVESAAGSASQDPAAFFGDGLRRMPPLSEVSRPIDVERLRWGLDVLEWLGRAIGGLEEVSWPSVADLGGPAEMFRSLLANLPEALGHPELAGEKSAAAAAMFDALATESVTDWRVIANQVDGWVVAADLVRLAQSEGLTPREKARLCDVYEGLTAPKLGVALSSAELAERAKPLLQARLEGELERGGARPVRRGIVLGLYWRALAGLWRELEDRPLPRRCATPSCGAMVPTTRNRRYCTTCQGERSRARVAALRARGGKLRDGLSLP